MWINESLHCKYKGYKDIVEFSTAIMKFQLRNPEDHHIHSNINKWKKQASFDIIHAISEDVT